MACWSRRLRRARHRGDDRGGALGAQHQLPFFGICLGLQIAVIEFARNVCGMTDTNSTEFEPDCPDGRSSP
jgi:hypothetical protein